MIFNKENYSTKVKEMLNKFILLIPETDPFSCGESRSSILSYFDGHFSRFVDGIQLLESKMEFEQDWQVLELGSPFPFYTFYFSTMLNWIVKCMDISMSKDIIFSDKIFATYGNICTDDFGRNKYNLITMCEVWEHLPCNLYKVLDKIILSLKDNGYLLCSYPLGGANASLENYSKDWSPDIDKFHGHLREFTMETAKEFIKELNIIDIQETSPPAYGKCLHILYRKVKK